MTDLSFVRAWNTVAELAPEREAVVCGDRRLTYGELHDRSARLAAAFVARGVVPGDRVAIELVNSPEYIETFYAAQLSGAIPVNVNYRYTGAELAYLLSNCEAAALVYHDDFAPAVAAALEELDSARPPVLVEVERSGTADGAAAANSIGEAYEHLVAEGDPATLASVGHEPNGDDLVFLYTGGTTGAPKAVMWRSDDLYRSIYQMSRPNAEPPDVARVIEKGKSAATALPACPLMHGTGLFTALASLSGAGKLVLVDRTHLDAEEIWSAVEREGVNLLTIVGDAFARPLLVALDAQPDRWDLTSLVAIMSSGVTWSPQAKEGLLEHLPHTLLIDSLGASEGLMTRTETRADEEIEPAKFKAGERLAVITDDDDFAQPGDGRIGMLGVGGAIPVGYYADPDKTAQTFRTIKGQRFSIPGDYATLEADGTITLLGRGSACINTGGEKVYPEEVELALRAHPAVFDTVVLGLPDERWGEKVVAMLVFAEAEHATADELHDWCRERLAGYKVPKEFIARDSLDRSPSGKADYKVLRAVATEALSTASIKETS